MAVNLNKSWIIISGKRTVSYKISRHKKSGEYSYSSSLLGSDYESLKKEYTSAENAVVRVIDLNKRRKSK
jgi:Mor family transcriptional regulator